jgi:HK97 family phage portal protein
MPNALEKIGNALTSSLPGYFGRRETQSYWPNRAQRIVYIQSTIAGVRVTPDTALQSATVWACVNVLSKSIAQLPWRMMREVAPGSSQNCPGALDDLLNHRTNPEMSAYTFRQTMVGHLVTWGNAYAEIERDNAGRPVALWPIEPDRVYVYRRWDTNRLYYQVTNQTKGLVELDFCDMFHVHGLSFDGITGYRTVGYGAQSIGLAMAIERFGASFFGNNCQFGGFIENSKSNLKPEAREALLGPLNENHRGPDQAFRVQYLDAGMKFTPINVEPEKGQFIASREHQIEEICRLFGVPPHKVAQLIRATNNNIEHQGIEFVVDGILPLTSLFEQEADYKLLSSRNPMGYFTRIDVRSLQRGDLAARQTFYSSMFDRGVLSPNDIREMEGLNPIADEEGGNKRFVPLNFQLLEDAGAPEDEATEPPDNSSGGAAAPNGAPSTGDSGAGGDTGSDAGDEGATSVDSKVREVPIRKTVSFIRDDSGEIVGGEITEEHPQ